MGGRCVFYFFVLLVPLVARPQSIGPVISWQKIAGGISGRTPTAIFEVRAWADGIVRIRVSKNKAFRDFSYALSAQQPQANPAVSVGDKDGRIVLATSGLIVTITKSPAFGVSFSDSLGNIINEDVPGTVGGTCFVGDRLTVYKKLQAGERFVGLGESLGNLDRRGMGITLNNTDNYKYGDPRLPMYSSIPFFIGIHHQQVYGLFFNNSYRSFFNLGLSTPDFSSISADGGDADYFLCYSPSIAGVLEQYTALTGRMPLPPLWSLGYHQSRCSYYPQSTVEWIASTFRQKKIPIDCIVLDADYLQEYEPFRINKKRFPDMAGMAARLRRMDIELTASVNPGIKLDSTYEANTDGLHHDVFLKYADGRPFVADIAPSTNHFVDFTDPKARSWWIDKMKFLPDNGIHGYWNDMNEPAVAGSYLPDNLVFDFDGHKTNALEGKNVYGMQMARSSYESALKYGDGRRPFVLTRSGFAGVQRYSAMWSGDNTAKDEFLLLGVLLNTQLGLSGMPFVGPDLGGYIGDGNKELYKRWVEVGVFSPFVRNHREFFANASEPWAYGEEAEALSRTYIGFRYRLMPYVYSKFYETSRTGIPVARSLCIDNPFEPRVFDAAYQYEFLFGDALLVAPLTSTEKYKKIFLPRGDWYDCWSDSLVAGDQERGAEYPIYQLPLFIRASGIVPMESLVQSTKEKPTDTLDVHIFYGREKNRFIYYEDDGATFDYRQGHFFRRPIEFDPVARQIVFGAGEGDYPSVFRQIRVILHGFPAIAGSRPWTGRLLDPLEGLQDFYDPATFRALRQAELPVRAQCITLDNSKGESRVTW